MMIIVLFCACQPSNATRQTLGGLSVSDGEDAAARTAAPAPHETVLSLATEQGFIGKHGSNYSYLDEDAAGHPLLIHETFSSRTHYKTLTPIIDMQGGTLFIDCTLIRAIEDVEVVSVGNYCRGKSAASMETIEDASSDQWVHTYSTSLLWLEGAAAKVGDCKHPKGLDFKEHRILRCQSGEGDETTLDVSTHILSSTLQVELTMTGFEFAGHLVSENALAFWRLDDFSHELVEKVVP
ncbi:hypothetical protein LY625_05090 [Lysobacter sp. GX 14042]|uniref:hypothetical protein n=1 Tax=Lysobacter sp. GX 14042 TaxID=2907155 RepID=UPI001F42A2DD|nr:hypothetical protein [Lysobacter sp. GX 14042]MCE7031997.1 hypothetical protein [Lysobacter sp. GX 14042]